MHKEQKTSQKFHHAEDQDADGFLREEYFERKEDKMHRGRNYSALKST